MSYTFKVGDEGKTGNGLRYKVLAVDQPLRSHLGSIVVLIESAPDSGTYFPTSRHADGRVSYRSIAQDGLDLVPPPVTMYQNAYVYGAGSAGAIAVPIEV